jgi:hypothetical protein
MNLFDRPTASRTDSLYRQTTMRLPFVSAAQRLSLAVVAQDALGAPCQLARQVVDTNPPQVKAFFAQDGRQVVTFLGYSAAEYEHRDVMLAEADRLLATLDPKRVWINIGATRDGIGAVYELAKRRGFATSGIVSMEAKRAGAELSPCVDQVFFVQDPTWGGYLPGTRTLSPTSEAMVAASDRMIAIGGGEVARDELLAARRLGKPTTFIPADMNHQIAIRKAASRGAAPPSDFRGAAGAELSPSTLSR